MVSGPTGLLSRCLKSLSPALRCCLRYNHLKSRSYFFLNKKICYRPAHLCDGAKPLVLIVLKTDCTKWIRDCFYTNWLFLVQCLVISILLLWHFADFSPAGTRCEAFDLAPCQLAGASQFTRLCADRQLSPWIGIPTTYCWLPAAAITRRTFSPPT